MTKFSRNCEVSIGLTAADLKEVRVMNRGRVAEDYRIVAADDLKNLEGKQGLGLVNEFKLPPLVRAPAAACPAGYCVCWVLGRPFCLPCYMCESTISFDPLEQWIRYERAFDVKAQLLSQVLSQAPIELKDRDLEYVDLTVRVLESKDGNELFVCLLADKQAWVPLSLR